MDTHKPYAILDTPGWSVTKVDGQLIDGKIRYAKGDWRMRVNWRPKRFFTGYLDSRRRIGQAKSLSLFQAPALCWSYHPNDHTVIRDPQGETFFEVRGEGMDATSFERLLTSLRLVDAAAFEATLPATIVRPAEMLCIIEALLMDVEVPPELGITDICVPAYQEPYHVAAHVTGQVGCAWIDRYEAAVLSGDSVMQCRAVHAMQGSRKWKVLRQMQGAGCWAEEFWRVAEEMASGEPVVGMRERISLSLPAGTIGRPSSS